MHNRPVSLASRVLSDPGQNGCLLHVRRNAHYDHRRHLYDITSLKVKCQKRDVRTDRKLRPGLRSGTERQPTHR